MKRWTLVLAALALSGCISDEPPTANKQPAAAPSDAALAINERPEPLGNYTGHSIYDTLYVSVRYGDKVMHHLLDEAVYTPRYVPLELKDMLISQIAAMGLFADVKPTRADTAQPTRGYLAAVTIAPNIDVTIQSSLKAYAALGVIDVNLDTEFEIVTRTTIKKLDSGSVQLVDDKYRLGGQANTLAYKQVSAAGTWPRIMGRVSPHVVNVIARSAIVDAAASKNTPAATGRGR